MNNTYEFTMDKCLLLDFDGVIINNETINENVTEKASCFLAKHTHIKPQSAVKINRKNYRKFGHTLYLTNYINKNKKKYEPLTIDDFNNYVYDEDFIRSNCLSHLNSNDTTLFTEWVYFIDETKRAALFNDVYIFSNAPSLWINQIMRELERLSGIKMNIDDVISVPEEFHNNLKPDLYPYDQFTSSYSYESEIIFVDDSETNLQYTRWTNVLFDPLKDRDKKADKNNQIKTITSPKELYLMI
jgi:FMN phosphatase YigB (HAD superfamily)